MRSNTISLMTPAELAIFNAMQEVEKAGAEAQSQQITNAISYLQMAKNEVSEFVDKQIKEELCK
jgi:hypothetical protein